MPFVFDFDSMALVLRQAEPVTIKGAWNVIKEGLIKSGEIVVNSGVVQKVMSITKTASATETAGETLSALCAMDVTEAEVAGATVTTLTPKAAVAFTPKTVALSAIAGAVGLDLGFRVGQNLVDLYFGDGWDWNAPGIYDAAKDAIRTYITADGKTYYDEETIEAIANRLNEIGAFNDGTFVIPESVDLTNFSTLNLQAFYFYYISNGYYKDLLELIMTKVPIKDLGGYIELSLLIYSGGDYSVDLISTNGKSLDINGGGLPFLIDENGFKYYGYHSIKTRHTVVCDHFMSM